jgi:nitrogen-specific signal transduction histidine kinase
MRDKSNRLLKINTNETKKGGEDFLDIFISDTGGGIPLELREGLFHPKENLGEREHGTGIGLPWTYSFLRSYGGSIEFTTGPAGTTMKITVPRDFRLNASFYSKKTGEKAK